jgi:hypothetical protein
MSIDTACISLEKEVRRPLLYVSEPTSQLIDKECLMPEPPEEMRRRTLRFKHLEEDATSYLTDHKLEARLNYYVLAFKGEQKFARFPIEVFLEEVHEIVRGRLKDWKEEEHIADNLLFRLAKREE